MKGVGETGVSPWRKAANEVSVGNRGVSQEQRSDALAEDVAT